MAAVAQSDAEIIGEAADLMYHSLLLLKAKGLSLAQVVAELEARHAAALTQPCGEAPAGSRVARKLRRNA